ALLTGKTAEIITIAVFGALTLYIFSMLALLKLRKAEPALHRPYKVPFYPLMPLIAFVIALASAIAMIIFNLKLAVFYFIIMGICFGLFKIFTKNAELN
ncbi:MAG TPA: ethanolamine permease, partial [Flavisolibacter sp.]|nr:ethanolamine permease [Flavisolibacter sp.]